MLPAQGYQRAVIVFGFDQGYIQFSQFSQLQQNWAVCPRVRSNAMLARERREARMMVVFWVSMWASRMSEEQGV
jgi:hypothetical protein